MKRLDTVLLLGAITVGGLVLRAHNLDAQPLWWDEGYSFFFATRDFVTMLERTALDIHPPLYYALLRVWMNIAGTSAAMARWFSVLIGTATIPLLYALARQLFSARVARVAALLLALSPLHIYYSQEVRMYGLVTLLGIASVHFFVRLRQMTPGKPSTARVALAYILVTTAALYTQYYAAFILASQIVVLCVWTWQERQSPSTDRSARLAHVAAGSPSSCSICLGCCTRDQNCTRTSPPKLPSKNTRRSIPSHFSRAISPRFRLDI
jgi:mannosyltransferase